MSKYRLVLKDTDINKQINNNLSTKVKDITSGWVIVTEKRWKDNGKEAIVSLIFDNLKEAKEYKDSLNKQPSKGSKYIIISCPDYQEYPKKPVKVSKDIYVEVTSRDKSTGKITIKEIIKLHRDSDKTAKADVEDYYLHNKNLDYIVIPKEDALKEAEENNLKIQDWTDIGSGEEVSK